MSNVLLNRAIERQNRAWNAMQEIRQRATAENRDLTAEERQAWDAAEVDVDEAGTDIERFEREAKLNSVDRSKVVTTDSGEERDATDGEKQYAAAFEAYARGGMRNLTGEQRDLLQRGYVKNAQGTSPDTAGGYLVPEGWRGTMVETMKAYGGLLGFVEIITTDSGNKLPWPTNDDTANEGEIIGENTQVGEQNLDFGGAELDAHIFSSKMIKVPYALMQDSGFDLNSFVPRKQGERIGRRAARAWTTGTGVKQPQGITVGIVAGKVGANGQTTSITYDDTIDLEHSVDPAYRLNARYAFHDLTLKVFRKLKDADNRPLWVPVPAPGFPATINGHQYTVDNSMPQMAAGANSIVFGDLRAGYVVRQVRGLQTLRLTERYAESLQVAFLGFSRMDGMIQDSAAIRSYQNSAV